MESLLIGLGIIVWVGLGVWGFIFWWTEDYDLTTTDLLGAIMIGTMLGPLAWGFGATLHGKSDSEPTPTQTVFKKKTKH